MILRGGEENEWQDENEMDWAGWMGARKKNLHRYHTTLGPIGVGV